VRFPQVADRFEAAIFEDNKISQIMPVVFVDAQAPGLTINEDLLVFAKTPRSDNIVDPAVSVCAQLIVDKSRKSCPIVFLRTTNDLFHEQFT
jgi:hypothetical protein